jgi:cytochrome P450 family 110
MTNHLTGPREMSPIQLMKWVTSPLNWLDECAEKYGDIYEFQWTGFPKSIMVGNSEAIKQIMMADPKIFESGTPLIEPLLGKNSLLAINGKEHERQRKLLMPPFHGERMRAYAEIIVDTTKEIISTWTLGKPVAIRRSMRQLSLCVMLRAVLGLSNGEKYQALQRILNSLLDMLGDPISSGLAFIPFLQFDLGPWSVYGKFIRQKKELDDLIYSEISCRRSSDYSRYTDVLSLLLSTRDEENLPMSDEEIRDELLTLLVAGTETTGSAIAWAVHWLSQNPEFSEILRKETIQSNGEISKSPFLNAVCLETLRLYPVAAITLPRTLKVEMNLLSHKISAGTRLYPCIYLLHRNNRLYPNAKSFNPERFLEESKFSQYEFMPFGGGNRRCIGQAFALYEIKLALATIFSQYTISPGNSKKDIEPVRWTINMVPPMDLQILPVIEHKRQNVNV